MQPSPIISGSSALLITQSFAIIYVGSLYLSKNTRLSFVSEPYRAKPGREDEERKKMKNERWGDDPEVIKARLAAVSIATVVCCLGVFAVFNHVGGTANDFEIAVEYTLLRLGFLPAFGLSASLAHLVTPLLFLGPLFGSYLSGALPFQRNWMWETHVVARYLSVYGLRNFWIAPLTEEIVFRACVLSIFHLSGASIKYMIFFTPLTFGLAHVHHAWDTYNRYGRTWLAARRALVTSVFQLCYTTLFGMHVSYLFLRTGSILPPITAHMWCNAMGIPEIVWELKTFPKYRKAIIAAYLSGIAAYIYTLQKWTQTNGNLYWPSTA